MENTSPQTANPSTHSTLAQGRPEQSRGATKLGTGHLLEFYGRECSHCVRMVPLVKQLEEETDLIITKYEVWHNEENAKILAQYAQGMCGGVPFFINTQTNQMICGSAPYDILKKWAFGQNIISEETP